VPPESPKKAVSRGCVASGLNVHGNTVSTRASRSTSTRDVTPAVIDSNSRWRPVAEKTAPRVDERSPPAKRGERKTEAPVARSTTTVSSMTEADGGSTPREPRAMRCAETGAVSHAATSTATK
jgi:hypothetical protein